MSGLFEHLELFDDSKRVASRKAVAVANKRVGDRVGAFLRNAASKDDFDGRLALVQDDITQIIADVVAEYGGDAERIAATILSGWEDLTRGPDGKWTSPGADTQLDGGEGTDIDSELAEAPSAVGADTGEGVLANADTFRAAADNLAPSCPECKSHTTGVVAQDGKCSCHGCGHSWTADGEVVSTGEGLTSSWSFHSADIPEGAGGTTKREDISKDTKPKTDKGSAGDEKGHNKRDVKTEDSNSPHKTVQQDIDDEADYTKDDFLDQTDSVTTQDELDTAGDWDAGFGHGGEEHGPHTDTWSTNEGQTNPVTSAVDPDKNPITEHLRSWEQDQQVQAAIAEFEKESPDA